MKSILTLAAILLCSYSTFAQQAFDSENLKVVNQQFILDFQSSPCSVSNQYQEPTDYKSKFRTFQLRDIYSNHEAMLPFDIYFSENGAAPFYRIHYGFCRPLSFSTPIRYQGHYFVTFNDTAQPTSIYINASTSNMNIEIRGNCNLHGTGDIDLRNSNSVKLVLNEKEVKILPQKLLCAFQEATLVKTENLSSKKLETIINVNIPYQSFFPNQQTIVDVYYQKDKHSPIFRMSEFSAIAISKMSYNTDKFGIYYTSFRTSYDEDACRVVFKNEIGETNKKSILSNCKN